MQHARAAALDALEELFAAMRKRGSVLNLTRGYVANELRQGDGIAGR